jgi:hypothetical protein
MDNAGSFSCGALDGVCCLAWMGESLYSFSPLYQAKTIPQLRQMVRHIKTNAAPRAPSVDPESTGLTAQQAAAAQGCGASVVGGRQAHLV